MNREQRRKYAKQVKNDKLAFECPVCHHKARFFTSARGEKDTVLKCEVCDGIVREGEILTKLMPPSIYLPIPLNALDNIIAAEMEKDNEQSIEDSPVTVEGEVT